MPANHAGWQLPYFMQWQGGPYKFFLAQKGLLGNCPGLWAVAAVDI